METSVSSDNSVSEFLKAHAIRASDTEDNNEGEEMIEIQCPMCKGEFRTDIDISIRTHELIVFRGRMVCLGRVGDTDALLDFVSNALNQKPKLQKKELISHLVKECRIPKQDATHLVEQLLRNGRLHEDGECLSFNG